ncbi:MAG: GNAT family N-acetyltransferase [Armatimonadetes bacterium]|jgi:ribosomal protein S18 acetylase RimI-like enzyme|nr:GNAT family N-acetyltransferase [Armatimonadota bacterium]
MQLTFRELAEDEVEGCARWLTLSEPWITLGFDQAKSEWALRRGGLEKWVAADTENTPVGIALLNFGGPFIGYLQILCVAPEQRGKGVGSALLDFVEERVFSRHPNLFLCVSDFNDGAQRLYQQRGFEQVGRLENFLVAGHAELLLRKTRGPIFGR